MFRYVDCLLLLTHLNVIVEPINLKPFMPAIVDCTSFTSFIVTIPVPGF